MDPAKIIGIAIFLYWAVTLLFIMRTVRREKAAFHKSAGRGNGGPVETDGNGSRFAGIYRTYIDLSGPTFLVVSNIISFFISVGFVCYLLIAGLYAA